MCIICKEPIIHKRKFINLFKPNLKTICKSCFRKFYNINPYFIIPIKNGLLHIYEMVFQATDDHDSYLDILSYYYDKCQKNLKTISFIFCETLSIKFIEVLELLELGHLIILTNKFKEE